MVNQNVEWCYAHKRYESIVDRIDFECSDTYLGYFYRKMMTYRMPEDYFLRDREIQEVKAEFLPQADELIAALRFEVTKLKRELELVRKNIVPTNGGKRDIKL